MDRLNDPFPTLADLSREHPEWLEPPRDGDRWGRWTYHAEAQVLAFVEPWDYEVDLRSARTDAERWDWARHLAGKVWVTDEDLGALVRALRALSPGRPHG